MEDELKEVPLFKTDLFPEDKKAVLEVLDSGYLSNGPKLEEFEKRISDYIGVPYAIGVNSGTSALHLAVKALGLKKGDEVITSPFSFIASSNCLLMEGVKPVFVDIDEKTYNLNPNLIEEKINSKTKAILPVDILGHPVDMDKILKISNKYNLPILEDSCEALGSKYKGRKVGSMSTIATFGFFPNKQITTGEGGMIVTPNEEIAELCKSLRAHGRDKTGNWLYHDKLGYNYKLDEMSAALGASQMGRIERILGKRKSVAKKYIERLKNLEEILLPYEENFSERSWFAFVITLKERNRKEIINYFKKFKIESRDYFAPIHLQPFYKKKFGYTEGDFPITEDISKRTLALPFWGGMKKDKINYVVEKLKEGLVDAKK